MAQVRTDVREQVDRFLDRLFTAWEELPRVAREIDGWDLIEQLDYIEEWGPKEDKLLRLRGLMASPEVTDEQKQRYERLERLVQANRPILERLRAS